MKKLIIGGLLATALFIGINTGVAHASIDVSLGYGSRGSEVTELQEFLIDHSYLTGNATGNFYSLTLKGVKAFQSDNNIPNTGYVGVLTRAEINKQILAETSDSTSEQLTETGTTTIPVIPSPVLSQLQQQNQILQQQLNQLQAQTQAQQLQSKTIQNSLNQIAQNTQPVIVPTSTVQQPVTPVPTSLVLTGPGGTNFIDPGYGGGCANVQAYAKVLDQNNNPIPNQQITITNPETGSVSTFSSDAAYTYVPQATSTIETLTASSNGLFASVNVTVGQDPFLNSVWYNMYYNSSGKSKLDGMTPSPTIVNGKCLTPAF